jgi:hypothetical protein
MFVTLNTINSVEHKILPNSIATMKQAFLMTPLTSCDRTQFLLVCTTLFIMLLLGNLEFFSQSDQQAIIALSLIDPIALRHSKKIILFVTILMKFLNSLFDFRLPGLQKRFHFIWNVSC